MPRSPPAKEGFDFGAGLRFQPRLGILAVERVSGLGAGPSRAIEFLGEAGDFRGMMLAGGAACAQAKEEVAAGEFGELDAAHAQAGASIVFGNPLHAGECGDLTPRVGDVGRWTAAGFEAGIEIAVVAGFGTLQVVAFVVGEEFEASGSGIEAEDAERGGALLPNG
jgi:hypothetical protein